MLQEVNSTGDNRQCFESVEQLESQNNCEACVPCVQYKSFQERLYQIPEKAFALHI